MEFIQFFKLFATSEQNYTALGVETIEGSHNFRLIRYSSRLFQIAGLLLEQMTSKLEKTKS